MKHEFLQLIDILGTVTFAISGVSAAMEKRLDVFGIVIIAFITAIGGGTLRDMMTGDLPVAWIRNINYSIIIVITSAVACIIGGSAYFLLLQTGINKDWMDVISIALIFLVRIVVVRYKLALPDIYNNLTPGPSPKERGN